MVRHYVGEFEPSSGQQDQDRLAPTNQPQSMARRNLITGHPSEYNTPLASFPPFARVAGLRPAIRDPACRTQSYEQREVHVLVWTIVATPPWPRAILPLFSANLGPRSRVMP